MNITLTPALEKRVREKIERGDYEDTDALVQEAVHRLIEEDDIDLEGLREKLRVADSEIDSGQFLELDQRTTKDLAQGIHERGLKKLAAERENPNAHS